MEGTGEGGGFCIVSLGLRTPLLTESLLPVTWGGSWWKCLCSASGDEGIGIGETIVRDSWLVPTLKYHISPYRPL